MFRPLHLITFKRLFFKVPNNLWKVLLTEIFDGIPWLLYFCGLSFPLKPREVINPFPDIYNSTIASEDVIFIFFKLTNSNDISNVTYSSLPLISLCFLTLIQPHLFMFAAEKQFPHIWNIPPRTSSHHRDRDK